MPRICWHKSDPAEREQKGEEKTNNVHTESYQQLSIPSQAFYRTKHYIIPTGLHYSSKPLSLYIYVYIYMMKQFHNILHGSIYKYRRRKKGSRTTSQAMDYTFWQKATKMLLDVRHITKERNFHRRRNRTAAFPGIR